MKAWLCRALVLGWVASLAAGCARTGRPRSAVADRAPTIRPMVAISVLENRASYKGSWKPAEGMTEALGLKLLESGRVVLLKSSDEGSLLGDVSRLGRDWLRKEEEESRVRPLRARYVIDGALIEFDPGGASSGRTRASNARVSIQLRVRDAMSDQILASISAQGTAKPERRDGDRAESPEPVFGSAAFYRLPTGRAVQAAVNRAVEELLRVLPAEPWDLRVAEVEEDRVVLNGGENAGLQVGQDLRVRQAPRSVTDPVRGHEIDRIPGETIGRVKVLEVRPASSLARLLEGRAARGDALEPMSTRNSRPSRR